MYFMSDPQALHVTRNVIPGKLGVDLHLHRVHIPLVAVTVTLGCNELDVAVLHCRRSVVRTIDFGSTAVRLLIRGT